MNTKRIKLAVTVLRGVLAKDVKQGWDLEEDLDTAHMDVHEALNAGFFPHEDTFEMESWGRQRDCKTVACMAGWLALDERMNAEGLFPKGKETLTNTLSLEPTYDGARGFKALQEFFDLDGPTTDHIFSSLRKSDLKAGIERLEGVLHEH